MTNTAKKPLTLKEFAQYILTLPAFTSCWFLGRHDSEKTRELCEDYTAAWDAIDAKAWFRYIPTLRGKVNEMIFGVEKLQARHKDDVRLLAEAHKERDAQVKGLEEANARLCKEVQAYKDQLLIATQMRDTAANEFYNAQSRIARLEERLELYATPHVLHYPHPAEGQPAPALPAWHRGNIPTSNLGMSAPITAVRCHELIAETLRKERNTLREQLTIMTSQRNTFRDERNALRAERDKIKKLLEEEYTA